MNAVSVHTSDSVILPALSWTRGPVAVRDALLVWLLVSFPTVTMLLVAVHAASADLNVFVHFL